MKRYIIAFLITSIAHGCTDAQSNRFWFCKSELKDCLSEFLIDRKEILNKSEGEALYITDISELEKGNIVGAKRGLQTGVYSFGILGPHYNQYLFFVEPNSTNIITNYSVKFVLVDLCDYFDRNEKSFTEDKKLKIAENVIKVLNLRMLNSKLDDENQLDIDLKRN
jgi:hypothetical protein